LLLIPLLVGCAVPTTSDLRKAEAATTVTVNAPLGCLYDAGVEQASSF
jgi:hypothetical protein